jgi:two-component system, OmpR family, alkaline phosphatase synthesis response regulator PhoP
MSPRRILVVDDEADIREVAQMSLETVSGWQVYTAQSGDEGITKAKQEKPDAILLDAMMPIMDGPSTFRKLQADPATRQIPVIMFTAKVQSADKQKFADLGVKDVIAKPFDPMQLGNQIAQILGWST